MSYRPPRYDRLILALEDDELETFVTEWAKKKQEYLSVQLFRGVGDMGRDVVGFHTKERHEGSWHNYQCKQYGKTLQTSVGLNEVGKLLYYSFKGEFTRPTGYMFVAPRGFNKTLKRLIANPSQFRDELFATWDQHCATKIIKNQTIPLDDPLKSFIAAWDFSCIAAIGLDDILADKIQARVVRLFRR